MTGPSYDACLVEAELKARAAYAAPGRHYHSERHLDECLAELAAIPGVAEADRRLLRWAILWHDAIYEPGLRDNEEKSAALAEHELVACGVAGAEAAEVARLIRLTKSHRCDAGDQLGCVLVSVDLAILGSEPERYAEYARDVRKEYSHVPEPMWRAGRAAVLNRLLDADPLYPHADFQTRLGGQARRNMEQELRSLAED